MKLCIILGTRPEIIKLSSIIRECEKKKLNYFIVHTNQHYSYEMDKIFFEELKLPFAKYNLEVGSGTHGFQTGNALEKIEKVILTEKPNVVLVQGDTNTTLSGALASAKLHIKVTHIESGMRSFNREMPEEINRILADHCSDFLFCSTKTAKNNLLKEGISKEKIFISGDTLVDATFQNLKIAEEKSSIIQKLNLKEKRYFLITIHRANNTDSKDNLLNILNALKEISAIYKMPIVFPMHPRTKERIKQFKLEKKLNIKNFMIIEPLGYLDFLKLEENAFIVLTDSGGVQEECCILKTPCITLRKETEWEETVKIKANILAGTSPKNIINCIEKMTKSKRNWKIPFGNGKSGEMILKNIGKAK